MTRQMNRAAARNAAKVDRSAAKVAARSAVRRTKKLTPLSKTQAAGYPDSLYVPFQATGKTYTTNGKREVARRLRQQVAA